MGEAFGLAHDVALENGVTVDAWLADDSGVNNSANVPRSGLRRLLLLYFAASFTPMSSAGGGVAIDRSNSHITTWITSMGHSAQRHKGGAARRMFAIWPGGVSRRGTAAELSAPSA